MPDNMSIGKSISGPIAGIYLHWFKNTFYLNKTCEFKLHFGKKMRDDILIIWKQGIQNLTAFTSI